MSKMVTALRKASEERSKAISPTEESQKNLVNEKKEEKMFKSWFTWVFVAAAAVTVLIAFNYQGGKDAVPLSTIFPDEEVFPVDVEYEFVQEEGVSKKEEVVEKIAKVTKVEQPVVKKEEIAKSIKTKAKAIVAPVKVNANKITNFTIQIASFKDQKKAEEALTKIRSKVPSAYVASRNLGSKGTWYRIYAGQFQRRSEAEVSLSSIKRNYNTSFIISPKAK